MGIDFNRSGASWSYSGFHHFRVRLASSIGVDLETMAGFCGDIPFPSRDRKPCGDKTWEQIDDAIVPLLNHSDCDGDMSPEQCAIVGPRLKEIAATWPESYDRRMGLILADDMIVCGESGLTLEFT